MSQIFYSSILASSLSPSDLGHFKQILHKINKAYEKKIFDFYRHPVFVQVDYLRKTNITQCCSLYLNHCVLLVQFFI